MFHASEPVTLSPVAVADLSSRAVTLALCSALHQLQGGS